MRPRPSPPPPSTLKQTASEYRAQRPLLSAAGRLLRTVASRDVWDRVLMALGALFFLLAVLHVVFKVWR